MSVKDALAKHAELIAPPDWCIQSLKRCGYTDAELNGVPYWIAYKMRAAAKNNGWRKP
jgi:hypothetical protein